MSQLVCTSNHCQSLHYTFPLRFPKCVTGAINCTSQHTPGVNIYEADLVAGTGYRILEHGGVGNQETTAHEYSCLPALLPSLPYF